MGDSSTAAGYNSNRQRDGSPTGFAMYLVFLPRCTTTFVVQLQAYLPQLFVAVKLSFKVAVEWRKLS